MLAGIPGMNFSTIGSSLSTNNDHVAANLLQQSLLFNPELAALFNLNQQHQSLQQVQQLNEATYNNGSDSTQQQSLMPAAVAAMGFPFFGVQSQFLTLQQQKNQLEQIHKVYIIVKHILKTYFFLAKSTVKFYATTFTKWYNYKA